MKRIEIEIDEQVQTPKWVNLQMKTKQSYRPTSAWTFVEMMNEATPPSMQPTSSEPTASGIGDFK